MDCPEGDPMLDLGTKLDSLKCCVVLLAPPPPGQLQAPGAPAVAVAAGGSGSGLAQDAGLVVQYMNRAAAEALKAVPHPSSAGAADASSPGAKATAASVPRSLPGPLLEDEGGSVAALLQQVRCTRGGVMCGFLGNSKRKWAFTKQIARQLGPPARLP